MRRQIKMAETPGHVVVCPLPASPTLGSFGKGRSHAVIPLRDRPAKGFGFWNFPFRSCQSTEMTARVLRYFQNGRTVGPQSGPPPAGGTLDPCKTLKDGAMLCSSCLAYLR